jgi:hypothetical protein
MAQPTKNRFIDHLAEGNDAESFFAAGQRNDARATIFARSACTILQAATAKLRFRAGAERHRASIARLRSRRRETDLARGKKRALFSPQSAGLPPREEVRDGPRPIALHSSRAASKLCNTSRQGQAASFMPKTFRQSDTPPPVEPEPDVKELIHANADTLLTRVLARSPSTRPKRITGRGFSVCVRAVVAGAMNPQPQPITLIVISERGKARRSSPRDAPGRLRRGEQ